MIDTSKNPQTKKYEVRYEKEVRKFVTKEEFILGNIGGLPDEGWLGEIWGKLPKKKE